MGRHLGHELRELETELEVRGVIRHGYRILEVHGPVVPNAIASVLLRIRHVTGLMPHIYFRWTEGNPITDLLRFLFMGEGEIPPSRAKSSGKPNRTSPAAPGSTSTDPELPKAWRVPVGGVGDAYDNALAESAIGLYKRECVRKGSPFMTGPHKQLADVEKATMNWVHWYHTGRLHSTLAMIPRDEFEQNYYAHVDASSDDEATSKQTA